MINAQQQLRRVTPVRLHGDAGVYVENMRFYWYGWRKLYTDMFSISIKADQVKWEDESGFTPEPDTW